MRNVKRLLALALAVGLLAMAGSVYAVGSAVDLGTAGAFAVLGGQSVTNTGPSVINGDLGVSPGTSVTGFPPGNVNGVTHSADAVALQAQTDLTIAYNNAAGQAPDASVSGDLGGLTLLPGVYKAQSSIGLTGTVTLDAQGDPNAIWIFQIGSAITTASASTVLMVNGGQPCNVYWQIGSSATLGTNSTFVGNILALTSISVTTGANIAGRALARNGSVSLDANVITRATCAVVPPPTPSPTPSPTPTPVPTPTPTPTPVPTPTATPVPTPTLTPVPTPSPTPVITAPPVPTPTPTPVPTPTPTPSETPVATESATATAAPSSTADSMATPILSAPATNVATATLTVPAATQPVVNGPGEIIPVPTPNVTLPPTDADPLADRSSNSSTLGGALVALGGLLVLAAAFIAKRRPASR